MKCVFNVSALVFGAALAVSAPVAAQTEAKTACETNGLSGDISHTLSDLPYNAFRIGILPEMGGGSGNFWATVKAQNHVTIELARPMRYCRWEISNTTCSAITEVAAALETLMVPVGKGHGAPLDRLTLHPTRYVLQVSSTYQQQHEISYSGDVDNAILAFMTHAQERLLTCVPTSVKAFINATTF